MQKETFQKAVEVLTEAREDLKHLFTSTEFSHIALIADSALTNLVNRLAHLGGLQITTVAPAHFEPLTSFMGEDLAVNNQIVKPEDYTPANDERNAFIKKVDMLQQNFDQLTDDQIMNTYTIPEEQLVLRGVAKRAGIEDFQTAPINIFFLQQVREGLKTVAANKANEDLIQAHQDKLDELNSLNDQLTDKKTKQQQLVTESEAKQLSIDEAKNAADKKKAEAELNGIEDQLIAVNKEITELEEKILAFSIDMENNQNE